MTEKVDCEKTLTPPDVLQWLEQRLKSVEYGEVGFTLTLVDGKVKRVKKIDEEQRKA